MAANGGISTGSARVDESELARALLACLSHDVRVPLGPLKLALSTLAEETQQVPDLSDLVSVAGAQLERLRRLIDALLRATRGPGRLEPSLVNLADLVESAAESFRAMGGSCEVSTQTALVECDRTLIGDALVDLMECAGGEGGDVRVDVTAAGAWANVRVRGDRAGQLLAALDLGVPRDSLSALGLGAAKILDASGGKIRVGEAELSALLPLAREP